MIRSLRFTFSVALLLLCCGATIIRNSVLLYPTGNVVGYNSIDATQAAGADACAQISQAAQALATANPLGGTIDARGFAGTSRPLVLARCSTAGQRPVSR